MKLSQFNSVLPYMDNYLLHNTYSDHYLMVKPILKELLEAANNENDLEGLADYHPAFFKELVNNNFIIEDDVNEVDQVKQISQQVDGNKANYLLTINPTMGCNFKCWYCYETHVKGSKMDLPLVERILKFIENEKENNRHLKFFSMSFFGGEPLMYYDKTVVPLLEGANKIFADSDIDFHSSFTTNGYLINQRRIDFFKKNSVTAVQITLDGHREFHDKVRYLSSKKGSYDRIIKNIKLLARHDIHITMRINFTRDNFTSCLDIPEDFRDLEADAMKNILVDFHQVWQDDQVDDLSTAPAVDAFKNVGFEVRSSATNLNNVVNSCYADKMNSSVVNYNGEVFKCTARDFTTENSLGYIGDDGRIHWKEEYERRQTAKFKNPPCLECRLLPICNGGCSQHAYENLGNKDGGYCVYGFDEFKKDATILERFRMRTNN
ncbi:MAG: radical SAM protein [Bacteroidota bacterium]